ncbi:MAG: type I-B CRISPR-associated protein Cas8b1/Cst1 [Ardenticatenaceae bacterium]|nr:type I-B CRISPR-associated protein Cas8b1/Cst1 [Ardenticatenaceae bacterium]
MLEYTGHPILDVGIATIVAFANKNLPQELTDDDLENAADYMHQLYTDPIFTGFISITFTINAGFTQPGFKKTPEKRNIYSERVLRSFRKSTPVLEEKGVFLGLPVADVPFDADGKLEHGRVFRQHMPMQTGEKTINFHPGGDAGLPVSGLALLAIQAYPLGSVKCGGRTLSIHSDSPDIMVYFAHQFLEENRYAIQMAQLENSKKMSEPYLKYRTLIIKTLLDALDMRQEQLDDEEPFSVTAYYMTNSGQGAGLDIYHLPSQLIEYLAEMYSAKYRLVWQQIEHLAWVRFKQTSKQKEAPADFRPDRNWLYEDLFSLAEDPYRNGRRFIRTYFLREAYKYARQDQTDPRGDYSTQKEAHLVSWKLTDCFLRRIMYMETERIEQIRRLGDALADYIKTQNDKRFFRAFYVENRYAYLRNGLIKANTAYVKSGHEPFLTLDSYISIFEDGEELSSRDWRLARDLVLIRLVEQLYKNGWLSANQDAVADVEVSDEENES